MKGITLLTALLLPVLLLVLGLELRLAICRLQIAVLKRQREKLLKKQCGQKTEAPHET